MKYLLILTLIIMSLSQLFAADFQLIKKHDVYKAKVINNSDPEGQKRVKIQLVSNTRSHMAWANIVAPTKGSYFIPDVGDEVIVAFLDGDPRRPIVLGCIQK